MNRLGGTGVARLDHRLLEPVSVDGVVGVTHRVQLVRTNAERQMRGIEWRLIQGHPSQTQRRCRDPEHRLEFRGDPGGGPAPVEKHPVDLRPGRKRPRGVAELGPPTGSDLPPANHLGRPDQVRAVVEWCRATACA